MFFRCPDGPDDRSPAPVRALVVPITAITAIAAITAMIPARTTDAFAYPSKPI